MKSSLNAYMFEKIKSLEVLCLATAYKGIVFPEFSELSF